MYQILQKLFENKTREERIEILKYKKEWHLDSGVFVIEDAVLKEK